MLWQGGTDARQFQPPVAQQSEVNGHAPRSNEPDGFEALPPTPATISDTPVSIPPRVSVLGTPKDTDLDVESDSSVPDDLQPCQDDLPSKRKDEVSAEVPKFGVSAESHRVSDLKTQVFEKNEA